jgi:hypothetical protein
MSIIIVLVGALVMLGIPALILKYQIEREEKKPVR